MKHTPAPWKVRFFNPNDEESEFFIEAKNNNKPELGYGIEIMGDDYGNHIGYPREQRLADAKLIAAAPELLKALKTALNIFGRGYEPKNGADDTVGSKTYLDCLNVIKKATE